MQQSIQIAVKRLQDGRIALEVPGPMSVAIVALPPDGWKAVLQLVEQETSKIMVANAPPNGFSLRK